MVETGLHGGGSAVFHGVILVAVFHISVIGNLMIINNGDNHEFYIMSDENINNGFWWQVIIFFILYNNLIPIVLEVIKCI